MIITLHNIGKRYQRDWIFRHVSLDFLPDNCYAVLGPNGSGKSTLLQIIAGHLTATEGTVQYHQQMPDRHVNAAAAEWVAAAQKQTGIPVEWIYQQVAICAPYLQLLEEMTLSELLRFHCRFKPLADHISHEQAIEIMQLRPAVHKQIRFYSSGMKQRVKLALALLSRATLVILDEPLTNLDEAGKQWYYHLLRQFTSGKIVLIGSNRAEEYALCNHKIDMLQYKI